MLRTKRREDFSLAFDFKAISRVYPGEYPTPYSKYTWYLYRCTRPAGQLHGKGREPPQSQLRSQKTRTKKNGAVIIRLLSLHPLSYRSKTSPSARSNSLKMVILLPSPLGLISATKGFAHVKKPSEYPVRGSTSTGARTSSMNSNAQSNLAIASQRLRSARWMPGHRRRPLP